VGRSLGAHCAPSVLESMKMEIAEHAGRVTRLLCQGGGQVTLGQPLVVIDTGEA